MPETFDYGRALAEAEKPMRATTHDHASVDSMSTEELQAEHARVNNATRAQQIRNELRRRNAL